MAAAFPALMMTGAAISAAGAIQQGNAAKSASTYNATLKERDAAIATQQANQEAQQVRWQSARMQGSLLAGYGASGVTAEGSPLDVLANSASQAKLDEETVLYRGKLKSTGFMSDAALSRYGGTVAQQDSQLKAASYLIGGAGQASYAGARAGADRDIAPAADERSIYAYGN